MAFLTKWPQGRELGAPEAVVQAFEALTAANPSGEPGAGGGGPYEFWFRSMEEALMGRGKLGSLVGASEDVKKAGGDSSLNDYAVRLLVLS
jgi:cytokinesis protein